MRKFMLKIYLGLDPFLCRSCKTIKYWLWQTVANIRQNGDWKNNSSLWSM